MLKKSKVEHPWLTKLIVRPSLKFFCLRHWDWMISCCCNFDFVIMFCLHNHVTQNEISCDVIWCLFRVLQDWVKAVGPGGRPLVWRSRWRQPRRETRLSRLRQSGDPTAEQELFGTSSGRLEPWRHALYDAHRALSVSRPAAGCALLKNTSRRLRHSRDNIEPSKVSHSQPVASRTCASSDDGGHSNASVV